MSDLQKLIIICLSLVTGLVCLAAAVMVFGPPDHTLSTATPTPKLEARPTPTWAAGWLGAYVACEKFVKDELNAPRAKFPPTYDADIEQLDASGQAWRISAWVEVKDPAGILRSDFTCQVRNVGGDRWALDNLHLSPP